MVTFFYLIMVTSTFCYFKGMRTHMSVQLVSQWNMLVNFPTQNWTSGFLIDCSPTSSPSSSPLFPQLFFMFLSTLCVLLVATSLAGGPTNVWIKNSQVTCHLTLKFVSPSKIHIFEYLQDSRLQLLNLSVDPRERHTVWGTVIGGGINWMIGFGPRQMMVRQQKHVEL